MPDASDAPRSKMRRSFPRGGELQIQVLAVLLSVLACGQLALNILHWFVPSH
jgi:hypothetical protein